MGQKKQRGSRLRRPHIFVVGIVIATAIAIGAFVWPLPIGRHQRTSVQEPKAKAEAVVVLDAASGQLLIGHQAHNAQAAGPLIDMLLLLYMATHHALNEDVVISQQAAARHGVRYGLTWGHTAPVETLLRMMWFTRARDAALALIEHAAGGEAAFHRQLRHFAQQIGAVDTNIVSLLRHNAPEQTTTAYDMALVARAIVTDNTLASFITMRRPVITWLDQQRLVVHANSFLWRYAGATGVLSGYTDASQYVVAASARRGGRHIIAIVLHAPTAEARWHDAQQFLNYAFAHYETLLNEPAVEALPYNVQAGDTLSSIARKTGVPADIIVAYNNVSHPDTLQAGMRLWLPVAASPSASEHSNGNRSILSGKNRVIRQLEAAG